MDKSSVQLSEYLCQYSRFARCGNDGNEEMYPLWLSYWENKQYMMLWDYPGSPKVSLIILVLPIGSVLRGC